MKLRYSLLTLGAIAAGALALHAAPGDGQRDGPPPGGPGGPDGQRHHRMVPPVIAALDADHDGVISAAEIADASKALLTLDKNGDGQLTREELMPPRPEGARGPGGPRGDDKSE